MARVKSISAKKHRKILKRTKGFKDARRKRIKAAIEASLHAGQYAYVGRKNRKRDMRALWITRISAGVKEEGINYNSFMSSLKKANIALNRKMLAELAANDSKTFMKIVEESKKFTSAK